MTPGLDARMTVIENGFSLDVHLAIEPGTTVALLGPNGAGKTTVVETLAGLRGLDAGRITLGGVVLDDPSEQRFVPAEERGIGVVFQDYVLFSHLSVAENVGFGLRARHLGRSETRVRTRAWLERVGIADLGERKVGELSGGQRQRVALARALAIEPELLLLDEPLAALDASTRTEIRHLLADHLAIFAGPRLLITHDPTEAFLLGDRIVVLEGGVVTQTGTADAVRLRPKTRYVADLAGANLVAGVASDGVVAVHGHRLHIADHDVTGHVLVTVHPRAIALYPDAPAGSPRNTWQTTITRVEHHGDRVRVQTGRPLPLTAEITPGAVDALGLHPGSEVWVSIKATELDVAPG